MPGWSAPITWFPTDLVTAAMLNAQLRDNMLVLNGATGPVLTNFTPTMSQLGGITLSTATGRYIRYGPLVIATTRCIASSSGTASNALVVGGLPVTALDTAAGGGTCFGFFSRASNPNYLLHGVWVSTTAVNFYSGGAATGLFGVNPAVTIVSGDEVDLTFIYNGS
jgi:hypothetical protein